jgi:hypothetical protein
MIFIASGLFAILVAVFAYIAVLTLWPYEPLRLDSITAEKSVACRGEELCFTIKGYKYHNIMAQVNVDLINSESIAIMHYPASMPAGEICRKRCFVVPHHVKPGKYKINWSATYEVNAFRNVTYRGQSEEVEIR